MGILQESGEIPNEPPSTGHWRDHLAHQASIEGPNFYDPPRERAAWGVEQDARLATPTEIMGIYTVVFCHRGGDLQAMIVFAPNQESAQTSVRVAYGGDITIAGVLDGRP